MSTLLLSSKEVSTEMPMKNLIPAVEDAFAAYEQGTAKMPPKSYIDLPEYNGDFRSMPAYLKTESWDAAGIKWVNVHPENPNHHDLPTVMGTVIYSDPETAYPLAVMDGTVLTQKRTGAAAAVATDYLAIEDATSMGIIGAGVQSYTQLEAISQVRPIEEVVISDVDSAAVEAFIADFSGQFDIKQGSISEAAKCDVLSTVTPVEEPIVDEEDVGKRTHINAMGADAAGKQELSDDILLSGRLVIDDYDQCTHSGEINVPWSQGILDDTDLDAQLGQIVTGDRPGRRTNDGVTIFDSTGLAIQDIAAAHVVYQHITADNDENRFDLVNE